MITDTLNCPNECCHGSEAVVLMLNKWNSKLCLNDAAAYKIIMAPSELFKQ